MEEVSWFVVLAVSSASGIMTGQQFDEYLAYTVYLCLQRGKTKRKITDNPRAMELCEKGADRGSPKQC